jgi:hypothetical protein
VTDDELLLRDIADEVARIAARHSEPGQVTIEPVGRWTCRITRSAPVAAIIRTQVERLGCAVTETSDGGMVTLLVDVEQAGQVEPIEPPEGWEERAMERFRRTRGE